MDSLLLLKKSIAEKKDVKLLASSEATSKVEKIEDAQYILFDENTSPILIDEPTKFIKLENDSHFSLRSVYFAWLLRDTSIAEYIQQCSELGIQNLTFLERTDLISWLEGSSDSEHIIGLEKPKPEGSTDAATSMDVDLHKKSEEVNWLFENTRTVSNHNSVLHGIKPIDFISLRKDVLDYIHANKATASAHADEQERPAKKRNRDPIILLSPSASSLLTMHNIKKFLEEGIFVPPAEAAHAAGGGRGPELIALSHKSSNSKFGTMRFIIVEGTEKFKPDYWDRVVCVFTTGQAWQFRDYKWSEPHQLFHHVKGFLVQYVGDPPHPATHDWNVEGIFVERLRRHTDREVVSQLWDKLERWMENRWPLWNGRR
ncbi:RNA polymerase II accessory factor, Cdc73 family [Schizosaccharomyces pombe]|uniref:Cell division control protein 73 n=1 Tax=Schizosaccharomyces pombe (strain 972 / ATCC 24843) TaxID=284812 RepID=CDC73_SCHPO|nr:putative Cdc73 family RNA polymerase II accessory factor [Schizosaccharomyces pombe]Q9UUE7.1 RecName: Full=Cell division control protein 73 [Schizosaccharomyces pombe 972h-]CAB52800.1 RNA polymerase II accessory factor, Cdc73 family (predicted) [Schizosaccharomyces pombe]|eukprot:NP_595891.1 putative Cdc73 family RNA polymerase II accessory factor [Schizosaccharomyces pombe]